MLYYALVFLVLGYRRRARRVRGCRDVHQFRLRPVRRGAGAVRGSLAQRAAYADTVATPPWRLGRPSPSRHGLALRDGYSSSTSSSVSASSSESSSSSNSASSSSVSSVSCVSSGIASGVACVCWGNSEPMASGSGVMGLGFM